VTVPKYRRLPGRRSHLFSYDTLWFAEDHLLLVRSTGYVERYQRYYFKDIQGFLMKPSSRFQQLNLGFGVPLALLVLLIALSSVTSAMGWVVAFTIFAIPFLSLILVNLVKGASCDTFVCTAVADVLLPPLGRQKAAFKALSQIQQLVVDAQGSVTAARLGLGPTDDPKIDSRVSRVSAGNRECKPTPVESIETPETSLYALGATELLVVISSLVLLNVGGGPVQSWLYFLSLALVLMSASVGLARQRRHARSPSLAALGHTLIAGTGAYVAFSLSVFRRSLAAAKAGGTSVEPTTMIDSSLPFAQAVLWLSMLGSLALAFWSVQRVLEQRRAGR
jgi:hypothetical protein